MAFLKNLWKSKESITIEISAADWIREILMDLLFLLVLYLFFRSVYILFILPVCIFLFHKYYKKELIRKYKERMNREFKDALLSLSSALQAGFSAENALQESWKEMQIVYGEDAPITRELTVMVNQVSLGVPLEAIFEEFSERTRVEDIATFSSVFQIAKRTGGDMVAVIRKTADDIASKIDTKNEIRVLISSKKLEQNIMSVMPLSIILYLEVTSGSMLDPLYGNWKGVLIMCFCMCIYAFAYFLSRKIMDIEV